MPYYRLSFLSYLLIVGCSQGHRLDMHQSSKKPLRNAIARGKAWKNNNPALVDFVEKVYVNNIKSVKKLLQANPSFAIDPIDELGTTALGVAVSKGCKEIVECLLTCPGHNFKQVCDKEGNGLLTIAILNGHTEIVKRLLEEKESGLDVDQPNKSGGTPLGVAVSKNQVEMVKLLLSSKATIDTNPSILLLICCKKNYIDMASLLLNHMENKSEMIAQKYKGFSPLQFAIKLGNIEYAQLLIKHGAAANPLLDDCSNALILATDSGHHAIVKLLLEAGANPNIETTDIENKTPLMIAASRGHKEIAAMLIENKKTDIAKINSHRRNALYFAIRFWNPDIINLLLDVKDKDVDLFQGKCSMLFIYLFIQYYEHKTSGNDRLLIQKICNKICNKCIGSELVIDDLVPELMKEEAKFIELLEFYITQEEGYEAAIKLDTIKPRGKPLLSYAVEHGYREIFTKLYQYVNNIDQKDPSGRTPLSYAAASGNFTMFNNLLKKDAGFKEQEFNCRSILSYALEGLNNSSDTIGSQCIVHKLLDHDGYNVSVAELTDTEYIQLLDFVLKNKKKVQWIPKLHIFDRFINPIRDHTQILSLLNKLSEEDDKSYLQQEDRAGRTLLSHFAQTGDLELVRKLMVQRTAIHMNQVDGMGKTPLFYALQAGHIAIIEILLQNRADLNHVDKKGCTPLLYAIQSKCSMDIIKMLLAHNADFSYCNLQNQGALSYAVDNNYLSIVDVLLPKMIRAPKCHTELCVALFLAKNKNDIELYNKLVNAIAPLFEEDDSQGWVDEQRSKKWKIKTVFYSVHAEQRAKERGIKLDAIKQVIQNPHAMQRSNQSDHILKLMDNNICVVVARQKEKINVITTYRIDA